MADHWGNTKGSYSFRFFSPEQVDQILCDGARHGRAGSHAAIERILKHEPGLERANLWRRIRKLKDRASGPAYCPSVWSSEDEKILRAGYQRGWSGKKEAVRELLRRHPEWRPHIVWRRAAKLGLTQSISKRSKQTGPRLWSEDDDRVLLNLAGYKSAKAIAKILHRTANAVLNRLSILGKSGRVSKDGYARRTLAEELHLGSRTIQRLIVEGLLEVRDPRITRKSLEDACKTGHLTASLHDQLRDAKESSTNPREDPAATPSNNCRRVAPGDSSKPPRSCRAKRIWADVARQFSVDASVIEQLIFRGVLKLYDPRVTEKSLTKFCGRYGALIKTDFLDAETRDWLAGSMDLAPSAGKDEAGGVEALRKHAQIVRTCGHCGRHIRGNVFFRHYKRCPQRNACSEPKAS